MATIDLAKYLTISAAARKFQRSRKLIRRLIALHGLRPVIAGTQKLLSPEDLKALKAAIRKCRKAG